MKAKNHKEIIYSYLVFLGYFTSLVIVSLTCWLLFFQTTKHFTYTLKLKKEELEHYEINKSLLSDRIDSINYFITILNTNLIDNEAALERKILQIKNEAIIKIEDLDKSGTNDFELYKNILLDVEKSIEAKKSLNQYKEEEYNLKNKLQDCGNANQKLKNRN